MEIKCPEPLQEDDPCHPRGRIVPVYAPKWRDVDVLETPKVLKLANHPQWELVRAITVATQRQGQALLALFPAFELLCRKGVVCLQCGRRCLVSQGQTHLISFWTYSMYLHAVEQPTLIHVVDVTPFVRVKNLMNSRKGSCNSSHVDWTAFPEPAMLLDPMTNLESFKPAIWKLKRRVIRVQAINDLHCALTYEVPTQVDMFLVGKEPFG